jgi:D-alanine-D-alanine ligase
VIDLNGKHIAVLKGGPGSERPVSLATAAGVTKALQSLGAKVTDVDVHGPDFVVPPDVEIAFITIHGTFGEDGQIQQILEDRGIAYTGEDVARSLTAFDKLMSKERFDAAGVTTPKWETIAVGERPKMPMPMVIKAPREGSTVGVYIVKTDAELEHALTDGAQYAKRLLVEEFIRARELTVGVLGDQALPIIEIVAKEGFYDFAEKYPFLTPNAAPGGGARHFCPAPIPEDQTRAIQEFALRAFRALDLQVYGRVDVMLTEQGDFTVLEINTIPGMTETSLLPEAAAAAGISYPELCARIIELSLAARGPKSA